MASKENKNYQRQFKPRSPDLSASDELEIKQAISKYPYKPKVPFCPANMKKRLEFAEKCLQFQKK